jgi:sec-independent protein translocase protein TatA
MLENLMQPMHLLLILFIALLFFGPSKLGDFGKGLGDGIRHFRDALKDGNSKTAGTAHVSAETSEPSAAQAVAVETPAVESQP